jgi:hypothetical protein
VRYRDRDHHRRCVHSAGADVAVGFYISTDETIATAPQDVLLTGGREFPFGPNGIAPNGLPAGQSIQDFLYGGASIRADSPTGSVYIDVLVDESGVFPETTKDDNTAFQPIEITATGDCPTQAQPDLVVSSMTHDPATPDTETQIEFTAVVENIGNATADPSTLSFKIGGESPSAPDALFDIPQLEPGDSETVVRNKTLSVAQNYQNTAAADYRQVVTESDESNNTTIDTFMVTKEGVETARLTATIVTLPLSGTLFDSSGLAIITPESVLPDTTVTYVPDGSTTSASFTYTLTDHSIDVTSGEGTVSLIILASPYGIDPCVAVGREAGCLPSP